MKTTYKETPMVHLGKFPIVITINVVVLVRQFVSTQRRFGVYDRGVDTKGKDEKGDSRRNAGIGFHVQAGQQQDLIQQAQLLRVPHRRGFRVKLLHFQGHDIATLFLIAVACVAVHNCCWWSWRC